ncbi:hypothetical protein [Thiocystis violacea]|uniref:hypothetical protein n=1 Tax=Thiocystis violacea TaxID=13725 RepID=UPI001908FF60|nr:hypothetical protein [Thiocystis violacea]MBK1719204.1 hypothetical protein [Thiocystis violacea]
MTDQPITADSALKLHPVWRQAAMEAVATFQYGETIPHDWLLEHLEIESPTGLMTADQHRAGQFELLRRVDGFKDVMLTDYQRYLVNVRGAGYKIIEPPHQTAAALRRLQTDLRKSLNAAMSALVHIDETALSLDASRENAEAKAKLKWFRTVGTKRLEAPSATQESDDEA